MAALANPNVILTDAIQQLQTQGRKILSTSTLSVSAVAAGGINGTPVAPPKNPGPGTIGNIPFVARNAEVTAFSSIFWIETIGNPDGSQFVQLQYTQTVLLQFSGLLWPHISVATLVKQ